MPPTPRNRPTFLASDRLLARVFARPVARFLHIEAAGGILLLAATLAALVWANSPWKDSYQELWETTMTISVGDFSVDEDLRHWVNDGLMALFFFVVGVEIKRELVSGQLSSKRDAALPALAALGGMAVPAAIYAAVNLGDSGGAGWGIPMATDIAFAVGVLVLLGDRVPAALKVLLLALAIVDDIGAIVVIAAFYTDELSTGWLALGGTGLLSVGVLRRLRVWYPAVYFAVGLFVWLAILESGIHATIAGVALGLLVPTRPFLSEVDADRIADELSADRRVEAAEVRDISFRIRESVPVAERLEELLHPWTSYVVVPVFALANAGIPLSGDALGDAAGSRVALGVALGLVAGKIIGVLGAAALAVRLGLGRLPDGVGWSHLTGMAALAGIGFTVSIFVSGLAFDDIARQDEAKIGVVAASVLAAGIGSMVLARAGSGSDQGQAANPEAVSTRNRASSA